MYEREIMFVCFPGFTR